MFNIFKSKLEKRLDEEIESLKSQYLTSKKYHSFSSMERDRAILQTLLYLKKGKRIFNVDKEFNVEEDNHEY